MAAKAMSYNNGVLPEKILQTKEELPACGLDPELFYLSDALYKQVVDGIPQPAVRCTQWQVDKMNDILATQLLTVDNCLIYRQLFCIRCNRQVTFFDTFMQALRGEHGLEFLRWSMLEPPRKLQNMAEKATKTVHCSGCDGVVGTFPKFTTPYAAYSCGCSRCC